MSLATFAVSAQESEITPVVKQLEELLKKHKDDRDQVSAAVKAVNDVLGPYQALTVERAIDDLNAWIDGLVVEADKTAALDKLNAKKLIDKINGLKSENDLDRVKRLTGEIVAAFGNGRFKAGENKALEDEAGKIIVAVDPFLNKASDAYIDGAIEALVRWIASAAKDDKKSEAALAKINTQKLVANIRSLHPDDLARVIAIATELNAQLNAGKFSGADYEDLMTDAALTTLGQRLDAILTARGPNIHIIKATYGDHRTGRVCDAFHYFRGKCEGKATCPANDNEIDGKKICNGEPAETAPGRVLAARVTYRCVSFTMRKLDAIDCAESACAAPSGCIGKPASALTAACGATVQAKTVYLQGNARIVCRVQP